MSDRTQALWRLLTVQAAWTYERMSGIGVGYAAEPLLRGVFADEPGARHDAIARSTGFFNSHPYLAGVGVGAVVRAERDLVPATMIGRLRTALSGPLGALGDQLVWAGWVPALVGLGLAASLWIGWPTLIVVVVVHNVLRLLLTRWGLDLGLREGLHVGAALQRSWIAARAPDAQRAAAFAVGLAIPIVVGTVLRGEPWPVGGGVVVVSLIGTTLTLWHVTRARVRGLPLGLALVLAAVIVMLATAL